MNGRDLIGLIVMAAVFPEARGCLFGLLAAVVALAVTFGLGFLTGRLTG